MRFSSWSIVHTYLLLYVLLFILSCCKATQQRLPIRCFYKNKENNRVGRNRWKMKGAKEEERGRKGDILSPHPLNFWPRKTEDYILAVMQQRREFIYVVHSWFRWSREGSGTGKIPLQAGDTIRHSDKCPHHRQATSRPGIPLCSYWPLPPWTDGSEIRRYSAATDRKHSQNSNPRQRTKSMALIFDDN